jgi:hypothetical protein
MAALTTARHEHAPSGDKPCNADQEYNQRFAVALGLRLSARDFAGDPRDSYGEPCADEDKKADHDHFGRTGPEGGDAPRFTFGHGLIIDGCACRVAVAVRKRDEEA